MKKIFILFLLILSIITIHKTYLLAGNNYTKLSEAEYFIRDVGELAIDILKTPADEKSKRILKLERMFDDYFAMELMSKVVIGAEAVRKNSTEVFEEFSFVFKKHLLKVYSSQLGTYRGQNLKLTAQIRGLMPLFIQ